MSDSDDHVIQSKKSKTTGVRGRRGFSKKKSADLENRHEISQSSAVYTTRVTKCFNDMVSHKIDQEIRHALVENINRDIEEDDITTSPKDRDNKQNKTEQDDDVLVLLDNEEGCEATHEDTQAKDLNNSAVKSRSPTPPPAPRDERTEKRQTRRMKRNVKKAVASLTQSLSSAESQLKEAVHFQSPDKDIYVVEDEEEVTVRVDILGKIHRFNLQVEEPFSSLVAKIAVQEKVDARTVMLVFDDRTILPRDTPHSIGLRTVEIIKCHIKANIDDSFNDSLSFDTDDANFLEIVIQSRQSRQREIIKTRPDKPLRTAMKEYATKVNKDFNSMKFWFDGEVITGDYTPLDLDMEDGDILDMQLL